MSKDKQNKKLGQIRKKLETAVIEHSSMEWTYDVVGLTGFSNWENAEEFALAHLIEVQQNESDLPWDMDWKLVEVSLGLIAPPESETIDPEISGAWQEKLEQGVKAPLIAQHIDSAPWTLARGEHIYQALKKLKRDKVWVLVSEKEGEHTEGFDQLEDWYGVNDPNDPDQGIDQTRFLLAKGNFFKQNPDQVLGEAFETTNSFNRNVTRHKGNIQNVVDGIGLSIPEQTTESDEVIMTNLKESLDELLEDDQAAQNISAVVEQYAIEKTIQSASKKGTSKDKPDIEELQSFDEVMKAYNDQITEDEVRAWVWYKIKTNGFNDVEVIHSPQNGWSKYITPKSEEAAHIKQWLDQGVLCYLNGDFIPSVLYYAENIYERLSRLESDSETIRLKFGEAQYDRQKSGLEEVRPDMLLLTDPQEDNRLVIKPISDFASETSISMLRDGKKLESSNRSPYGTASSGKSLKAAFYEWLGDIHKDEFKKSTGYDIRKSYLDNRLLSGYEKEERLRRKQSAKEEGDRLFSKFLSEALLPADQNRIARIWNSRFNGYVPINYFKIPTAFTCSKTFKNKPLFVRPAQREGIGFLSIQGSGCIAYDVGVGKTMTGILAIAQAMESGQCKRPLIVVPNQTYKNWIAEIGGKIGKKGKVLLSGILPQYQINDLYNLGDKYLKQLKNEDGSFDAVPENSITVITYEGMRRLGFNTETWAEHGSEMYRILNQGVDDSLGVKSERMKHALKEKIAELMGRGLEGTTVNIEDLGFDFLLTDEAHIQKKIFASVKGKVNKATDKRDSSHYRFNAGQPSNLGLKGFMLSQYILRKNNNKNVVLLTATPFTNNPLEIFSMLALIGFHRLVESNIDSLQGFFNHFIKTSIVLTINAKMRPERKEVVLGFQNLVALQKLIFRFIDYKSGEDANIQRPNKWVLPLTHKKVEDKFVPLPIDEQISTNLPLMGEQKGMMSQLEQYITGDLSFEDFCVNPTGLEEESSDPVEGMAVDERMMTEKEQEGARVLRGVTLGRQIALSPYLFSCNRVAAENLNYKTYVNSSPKLKYVMGCIKTVQQYHKDHGEEMSGQVIYMNAGIEYFPLIKEYLVKELGFDETEIDFIKGGMSPRKKETVKEKFLDGQVKVLLGSQAIKEGINLQNRATVLYNLWPDWNPTDLKQLEGRIWRFGNQYANVRIVIPLMEDSVDTAIFQKLEEKTSRLNEIWQKAGKLNTLKLEEFNPAELKMGLITDPEKIAEIQLLEKREHFEDEIMGLHNQVEELNEIKIARNEFESNIGTIEAKVAAYKPLEEEEPARSTEAVLRLFRKFLDDPDQTHGYMDTVVFDKVRKAYTNLQRALERILEPRGMDLNFEADKIVDWIKKEIEELTQVMEDLTGSKAKAELVEQIIEQREESGYQPKSVEERISEFASLNEELLGDKMIYGDLEEEKVERNKVIGLNQDLDDSDDVLAEMERIVSDVLEMEQLIKEMDELRNAA